MTPVFDNIRWGRQMAVGLSMMAIFGDFGGYFFGNVRDKTSNIIWQYATGYPLKFVAK